MNSKEQKNLMLLLQNDPLLSYTDISKKMEITAPTAKSWIESLISEKLILGVNGIVDINKLGLENHTYKISIENSEETFKMLDYLAEIHPYTYYKNYFFGGSSGIFIQFNLPVGAKKKIDDLFSKLHKISGINKIINFSGYNIDINTYPKINNFSNGRWIFNFDHWFEETDIKELKLDNNKESLLHKLYIEDVIIAREIRIEARRKQIDIIKSILENKNNNYNKSEVKLFDTSRKRQVSRRFEFIRKNNIVNHYQLRYNRDKFKLYNQLLFTGILKEGMVNQLINALNTNPPPFRSNFKLFDYNSFTWWIDLPPHHISPFTNFLYSLSSKMELSMLDSKHIRSYPLWHRNFIYGDNNSWKKSKKWIIEEPYREIETRFNN